MVWVGAELDHRKRRLLWDQTDCKIYIRLEAPGHGGSWSRAEHSITPIRVMDRLRINKLNF